jgi:dephospho-CoA kinase
VVKIIIGIAGRSGSGKSVAAAMMNKMIPDSQVYTLSDELMQMALAIDPIIAEDPYAGYQHRLSDYVRDHGWDEAKRDPEVRRFLQRLGTDGVRNCLHEDVWVEKMLDAYDNSPAETVFIVPSIRFENEEMACDYIIVVERSNGTLRGSNANHISEMYRVHNPDAVIQNEGSLDDLRNQIAAFITDVLGMELD